MDNIFRIEVDTGSGGYGFTDTLPELLADVDMEYGTKEVKKVSEWTKTSKDGDEYVSEDGKMHIFNMGKEILERLEVVRMSDITEIVNIIEKSWGVNSIGCPFGSCTEEFANKKMLEIANKNNFPDDVLKLIKANPIKFHKYQKFDNGRGIGRYYANLIRQMK